MNFVFAKRLNGVGIGMTACLLSALACSVETDADFVDAEDPVIIGKNDLLPVAQNGSNVPERYRALLNGFGRANYKNALCTATHVGNGLVISAGHCFSATSTRQNNVSCSGGYVDWGMRAGTKVSRSNCEQILAMRTGNGYDYAIYRVSPVPPTTVPVQLSPAATKGTALTIFSHPGGRPLEWSRTCSVSNTNATQLWYQCDTQGGSSGASVLRDDTLQVVGIHWGGGGDSNVANAISSTPLAEFMGGGQPQPTGGRIVSRQSGKCLDVNASGTADGTNIQLWNCNGTGAQRFRTEDLGGGNFSLVNTASGKCVDVSRSGVADGTNVQLWTCNRTGAQTFRRQDVGGGFGNLVNTNSGKCLDVSGFGTADGTNVQIWSCGNNQDNQVWRIE
jgi:V8-like Glu-specific endopeptidase